MSSPLCYVEGFKANKAKPLIDRPIKSNQIITTHPIAIKLPLASLLAESRLANFIARLLRFQITNKQTDKYRLQNSDTLPNPLQAANSSINRLFNPRDNCKIVSKLIRFRDFLSGERIDFGRRFIAVKLWMDFRAREYFSIKSALHLHVRLSRNQQASQRSTNCTALAKAKKPSSPI